MDTYLESMVDDLTNLVRVIGKDGKLRRWFDGLTSKSVEDRRNVIYATSARMTSMKENSNLIWTLKLLAIPQVFEAARLILEQSA